MRDCARAVSPIGWGVLRWLLLLLSAAAAALGLLTVLKAPASLPWTLAVLAGEYGYLVALVPALCLLATLLMGPGILRPLIRLASLAAVGLLVQPCFQAWWIGRGLPARLRAAFGPATVAFPPFAWDRLFGGSTPPVRCDTVDFAPGQQLDFYRSMARQASPCVIVLHGGGWNSGERGQIPALNWWLARQGYAVADVSYRLAPAAVWPAQRDDVRRALGYLQERAVALGIDPHRFVLLGRSAGGEIAEAAGYAFHDPAIRGVVGLYAPADMNFAYRFGDENDILHSLSLLRMFLGGPPAAAGPAYESASSIRLVAPGTPPTLLVHGTLDTLVWYKQSTRLQARLQAAAVPNCLLTLPWATHAVEYHEQGPSGQLSRYAIAWFLSSLTR